LDNLKTITVTVNDKEYTRDVEPRLLLSDFLRHTLGLTGTHVGCEHGVCGACTVQLDGEPVRSYRDIKILMIDQPPGSEIELRVSRKLFFGNEETDDVRFALVAGGS